MYNPKKERRKRHFGERRGRGSPLRDRAPEKDRAIDRVKVGQADRVKVQRTDQVQVQTFGSNRHNRQTGAGESSGRGPRRQGGGSSPLASLIKTLIAGMVLFIILVIILAFFWLRAGEAESQRTTSAEAVADMQKSTRQERLEQQRARAKAIAAIQLQRLIHRIEPLDRARFDDVGSRRTALTRLKAQVHRIDVGLPYYQGFRKQVDRLVDSY
ncbi:MAG: hypothetical protein R3236_09455, partial [Phycisphaeraceae bacterium]|nr:hypothetical protein [Phycisphaeraceae bacterium]